eukprot:362220-Chlamydomonas_euryale.AAC.15
MQLGGKKIERSKQYSLTARETVLLAVQQLWRNILLLKNVRDLKASYVTQHVAIGVQGVTRAAHAQITSASRSPDPSCRTVHTCTGHCSHPHRTLFTPAPDTVHTCTGHCSHPHRTLFTPAPDTVHTRTGHAY